MKKKENRGDMLGIRMGALLVPITASAHLLDRRIHKPAAWGVSILAWMVVGYWIPPRPQSKFTRWLILIVSLSLLMFLLATLFPDMF
jgi:hypothetical protein